MKKTQESEKMKNFNSKIEIQEKCGADRLRGGVPKNPHIYVGVLLGTRPLLQKPSFSPTNRVSVLGRK